MNVINYSYTVGININCGLNKWFTTVILYQEGIMPRKELITVTSVFVSICDVANVGTINFYGRIHIK